MQYKLQIHKAVQNSCVCVDTSVFYSAFICAETGLFGVPLSTLLEMDQRRDPGTKVPFILQRVRSPDSHSVIFRRKDEGKSCNATTAIKQPILLFLPHITIQFAHIPTAELALQLQL